MMEHSPGRVHSQTPVRGAGSRLCRESFAIREAPWRMHRVHRAEQMPCRVVNLAEPWCIMGDPWGDRATDVAVLGWMCRRRFGYSGPR